MLPTNNYLEDALRKKNHKTCRGFAKKKYKLELKLAEIK